MFKKLTQYQEQLPLLVLTLVLLPLMKIGPHFEPDTGSYLNYSQARMPGLYLILKGFRAIFGDNFKLLVVLQLLGGGWAILRLSALLKRLFSLSGAFQSLLCLALLMPYLNFFGNAVLTEGITYPIFLLFVHTSLETILENKPGFGRLLLLTGLLILIRKQFLFLLPPLTFLALYRWWQGESRKTFLKMSGGVLLCFVLTGLVERTYHYAYGGHFKAIPQTGFHLIAGALFVAHPSDTRLFEGDEKILFDTLYGQMLERNFVSREDLIPEGQLFPAHVYHRFYEAHCPITYQFTNKLSKPLAHLDGYGLEALKTSVAVTLIIHNFSEYTKLYVKNIILNIGGWYYAFLVISTALMALWFLLRTREKIYGAIVWAFGLTFSNYALVALVEPVHRRYSFYTDGLILSVFLIMAWSYLRRTHKAS